MAIDEIGVRLREKALYRHPGWCGGSVNGCTHWKEEEKAVDDLLAYTSARGRVEVLKHVLHPAMCEREQAWTRRELENAEADLDRIIREVSE